MSYVVEAWVQVERDDDFLPDGKVPDGKKKPPLFHSLSEAKKFADERIEKMRAPQSVVEVRERNGPAKYRVTRDSTENIQRIPIV